MQQSALSRLRFASPTYAALNPPRSSSPARHPLFLPFLLLSLLLLIIRLYITMSSSRPRPHYILDSHVHLWPASAANSESHAWMTPSDMPLARSFEMEEYIGALAGSVDVVYDGGGKSRGEDRIEQGKDVDVVAKNRAQLLGMIYIETDRRLLSPSLASEAGDTPAYPRRYTHPLAELSYLRHLIEAESSTTITTSTSPPTPRLLGLVPWAPIDEGPAALETYMKLAREVTGEATWARIVGWRFLVQGLRTEEAFRKVVGSGEWIEGLRWLLSLIHI